MGLSVYYIKTPSLKLDTLNQSKTLNWYLDLENIECLRKKLIRYEKNHKTLE